jgi:hypothetical protein
MSKSMKLPPFRQPNCIASCRNKHKCVGYKTWNQCPARLADERIGIYKNG